MFSKLSRPYNAASLPAPKRLRRNLEELYTNNNISAARAQELFNDAAAAGDTHCRPLRGRLDGRNVARRLRRQLLKQSQWPPLYHCWVRVKNIKTGQEELQQIAVLLPLEILAQLVKMGNLDKLYEKTGMDPLTKQHVESVETTLQQKLIGVGIWGDGAPCNWDRSDSIEVFSMLLPGLSEEWRNLRIPLTGLSKNMSSLLPPFMIFVKCLHGALST